MTENEILGMYVKERFPNIEKSVEFAVYAMGYRLRRVLGDMSLLIKSSFEDKDKQSEVNAYEEDDRGIDEGGPVEG